MRFRTIATNSTILSHDARFLFFDSEQPACVSVTSVFVIMIPDWSDVWEHTSAA